IDRAVLAANQNGISMWEVLERASEFGFKAGTLEAIDNFVLMIRSFSSMLATKNAYDVAQHVGKQTNFVRELFNDKSTEGVARYENIQELLNSIKEWVDNQQNLAQIDEDGILLEPIEDTAFPESELPSRPPLQPAELSLGTYLQQITLLTDADEKD